MLSESVVVVFPVIKFFFPFQIPYALQVFLGGIGTMQIWDLNCSGLQLKINKTNKNTDYYF